MNKVCLFCQPEKTSKCLKGTRTREPQTKCVKLQADANIRNIVTEKQYTKILVVVTRELPAAEACYHKPSYKSYIIKTDIKDQTETDTDIDTKWQKLSLTSKFFNTSGKRYFDI